MESEPQSVSGLIGASLKCTAEEEFVNRRTEPQEVCYTKSHQGSPEVEGTVSIAEGNVSPCRSLPFQQGQLPLPNRAPYIELPLADSLNDQQQTATTSNYSTSQTPTCIVPNLGAVATSHSSTAATAGTQSRETVMGEGAPITNRLDQKNLYNQQNSSGITVTLEGQELWEEFYKRGTEMIVNRAGRRMFPGLALNVSGLKPKHKYTMKMEIILADKHRFKFLNCQWIAVGTSEPQPVSTTIVHPDSPNSGNYWMRQGISFRKVKITNNKDNPKGNVILHSMHKYCLRLIIEEHKKPLPNSPPSLSKTVLIRDFPETTFITVTAYQNEEVTQLKISNNPFAKAFREGSGQYDWDTIQMFYSNQGQSRSLPGALGSPLPGYGQLSSPMLPPTPITPGMYLPNQGWCANTSHPTSHPQVMDCSPNFHPLPGIFEWPPQGNIQMSTPTSAILHNPPPIHPAPFHLPDHAKIASGFHAFQNPSSMDDTRNQVLRGTTSYTLAPTVTRTFDQHAQSDFYAGQSNPNSVLPTPTCCS